MILREIKTATDFTDFAIGEIREIRGPFFEYHKVLYCSPMTAQPAENRTFNSHFAKIAARFPDRIAFRQKTADGYAELSYAEVHDRALGVAAGLLALHLKPGARAAILSENRPEWVIAYLGILLAGGVAVPLDPQISPEEWKRLLDDSEAQFVFVSGLHHARLRGALQDSLLANRLICFDPLGGDRDARSELGGLVEWARSLQPAPALPPVDASDLLVIIYTSGTTGKPKGVMLTQENIMSEIVGALSLIRADEKDSLLCLLPLQHVFASVINVLLPLYLGARVHFVDTLRRSEILEELRSGQISILATVPQFFYLFHDRIKDELSRKPAAVRRLFQAMRIFNRFCLRVLRLNLGKLLFKKVHESFGASLRLFVSGGSAFDPAVAQEFFDMGFTILQGYGLTETSGGATVTSVEDNVIGSVGKPLPGVEIKIVDPDETGAGEVLIRGPIVMKGYYKNPAATAEAISEGWFRSGDLGRLDAGGHLFITGRKKEVIVLPNGKNIYPDELEAHYLQSPYIQEIAVIGVVSPGSHERSERLHAVVVPDFDYLKARRIANAREAVRDEIGKWSIPLPKYKRLMSYQIQKDPLPRTTTRKIKRLELKRLVEAGQLADEAAVTQDAGSPAAALSAEDEALWNSRIGQETVRCLAETYRRKAPKDLSANLELDLGFDSMERVELLASLEQALSVELPDDFGAEVHTLRDLITGLQRHAAAPRRPAAAARQSWDEILSERSLAQNGHSGIRFSGGALTLFKFLCFRLAYVVFRVFLGLKAEGLERLPAQGSFLLCPNHLSYIDPLVVLAVLPYRVFRRVFFVGASEYFSSWYMRLLARLSNVAPVDPDAHLLQAMKVGAYGLRSGRILCIFPEGARSFDGELKEFKKGASILAREVGVPIVPVAIEGTFEVWPRDSMRIRPHKVKLMFGAPMRAESADHGDPYQATTDKLQRTVAQMVRELEA
jgi:long-chain acyl-CoA synthetase